MSPEERNNRKKEEAQQEKAQDSDSAAKIAASSSYALSDPERSSASLTELMHSGIGLPSPFMKEIFLLRQAIVGTRFLGGSDELVEDLRPGSRITFVAEPDNPYDEHAVMALDPQGRKLGYIPKHENAVIGALLKAGKSIYGIMPGEQPHVWTVNKHTPSSLWVDLYMKEFLLPDDLSQIPRQGYQGSYAVVDIVLSEKPAESVSASAGEAFSSGIDSIYAIKVINGEERDNFSGQAAEEDPERDSESAKNLISRFRTFTGYLPIVGHEIEEETIPVLEEAYGMLLGIPFSNRVIDTQVMAMNHMPWARDYSLEALAEKLGIEVHSDTEAENRCRKTWKLYCRMERSELEKKSDRETEEDRDADGKAAVNKLDLSVEEYPMSDHARRILRANDIMTLRDLSRCTREEIAQFRWAEQEQQEEIRRMIFAAGTTFRPPGVEKTLYGYPQSLRRIAAKKETTWEYRLFFGIVITYYEWLQCPRALPTRLWEVGKEYKTILEDHDVIRFMEEHLEEQKNYIIEFSETVHDRLKQAVQDSKDSGDAYAVVKTAEDVMAIYKKIIIYKWNFQYIFAEPRFRILIEELERMTDGLLAGFDDLYLKSKDAIKQLEQYLSGEIEAEELHINLSIDFRINTDRVSAAMDEFAKSV